MWSPAVSVLALLTAALCLSARWRGTASVSALAPIGMHGLRALWGPATLLALATARTALADEYSYVNPNRKRREEEQQRRQQQEQEQQHRQYFHGQQQQRYHHQEQQHWGHGNGESFHGFGDQQGGGFQNLFDQLFGGGGGGGGIKFTFNGGGGGGGGPFGGFGGQHFFFNQGGGGGFPPQNAEDSPHYAVKALKAFGLPPDADINQVKKKYRSLALKYHPDRCKEDECERKMMKVNKFYEAIQKYIKTRS